MLIEGIRGGGDDDAAPRLAWAPCWCRGATSIDALSVGFTIAEYDRLMAPGLFPDHCGGDAVHLSGGLVLGRKFGMRLAGRAQIWAGPS